MDSTLLLLDTTKGKQIKQKACFASFLFLSCNCFGKEGEERREGGRATKTDVTDPTDLKYLLLGAPTLVTLSYSEWMQEVLEGGLLIKLPGLRVTCWLRLKGLSEGTPDDPSLALGTVAL